MIKRKTCERHPNPSDADVADIIELFDKHDGVDDVTIPTFVSVGMNAMPSIDMECMAGVLCSLRDEVAATRAERDRDIMVLEKSDTIMQELADIKTLCKRSAPGVESKANESKGIIPSAG